MRRVLDKLARINETPVPSNQFFQKGILPFMEVHPPFHQNFYRIFCPASCSCLQHYTIYPTRQFLPVLKIWVFSVDSFGCKKVFCWGNWSEQETRIEQRWPVQKKTPPAYGISSKPKNLRCYLPHEICLSASTSKYMECRTLEQQHITTVATLCSYPKGR